MLKFDPSTGRVDSSGLKIEVIDRRNAARTMDDQVRLDASLLLVMPAVDDQPAIPTFYARDAGAEADIDTDGARLVDQTVNQIGIEERQRPRGPR